MKTLLIFLAIPAIHALAGIAELDQAIQAVAPIDGVSSSGRIDFKPEATNSQRTAAESIMNAYLADPVAWSAAHPAFESPEDFLAQAGFNAARLLSLKDIQDQLAAAQIALPPKSAAVRAWLTEIQLADGPPYPPAPHSYEDLRAELKAILQP